MVLESFLASWFGAPSEIIILTPHAFSEIYTLRNNVSQTSKVVVSFCLQIVY